MTLRMLSGPELYSAMVTGVASVMLVKSTFPDLFDGLSDKLELVYRRLRSRFVTPELKVMIPEYEGLAKNQVYQVTEIYLAGKISPTTRAIRLSKLERDSSFKVAMEKDEQVEDVFDGTKFTWKAMCTSEGKCVGRTNGGSSYLTEVRLFVLSFHLAQKDKVLESYLRHVMQSAKAIEDEHKTQKLCTIDRDALYDGRLSDIWKSVNLEHPSTFDKLALEPELKTSILDDLDGFIARKEFYKRVGKAWKRGYLLYGPPGTGKSSLIAAIANYLKFDVYDLDLTQLSDNSELRKLMIATTNRSILVVEDIDCSTNLQNRAQQQHQENNRVTLSALLNFLDGLWTTCGDERIIIFTTNHKDKLDPALLRPGRMDVHIHLSYCTPPAFRILANNYLSIKDHPSFENIEKLITEVQVTPADVAEKLLKNARPDVVLQQLVEFLDAKKNEPPPPPVTENQAGKKNVTKNQQDGAEASTPIEDTKEGAEAP